LTAIEDFLTDCDVRMHKSIDATRTEFNSVRTGRASAPVAVSAKMLTHVTLQSQYTDDRWTAHQPR